MAYYDSIQNESDYQAAASSRQAQSFEALQSSTHEKVAAYHWGADHLFALRVICKPPNAVLPLLKSEISRVKAVKNEWHDVINELIQGPRESNATLGQMWEGDILRSYQNSVTGPIWADLVSTLKLQAPNDGLIPEGSGPNPQSDCIIYHEHVEEPLMARTTAFFANTLIQTIIAFAQPLGKCTVQLRWDRRIHWGQNSWSFDEGGVEVEALPSRKQVALFESKRLFQHVKNGEPTVSDGLLSQVVGVALAMRDSGHHIKFFHLTITDTFYNRFKTLSPRDETTGLESFLPVESTEWLDAATMDGRQSIAHHVMALVRWADEIALNGESDDKVSSQDEMTDTSH
ncbi:hypothetical protein CFAM422_005309 [Trichoderma lentiforme]|uniref:Uncharacterized protein n=1 Tax=Trichoderma lentiforme TaxID=1567552 RepID=A0A9P5CEC1_9HYPO|nr:hypothetical protein CFAM422_005309 [Trichoderma lentiforme]